MTSKGRTIWTVIISILIGIVAGVLIDQTFLRGRGRFGGGTPRYERFKNRVLQELALTPDQQSQLEELLQRRQEVFNEFRKELDSQFINLREATRDSIRGILTPDQREKFEGLVKEFDAGRRRDPKK